MRIRRHLAQALRNLRSHALRTFLTMLGIIIAFGVAYNSARIQLSERARELASLRVLGFTRGEVARITAKINSLQDAEVIEALYAAADGRGHPPSESAIDCRGPH